MKEETIGNRKVEFYSVEVNQEISFVATFLYQDVLHIVETNLPLDKLQEIIKEAKGTYEK